jgi:putative transposon-encoded protein
MPRKVKAVRGGKINLQDEVEEIYEKKVTPYGNGAKVDAQKKYIGRRAYLIVLKKD